MTVFMCTLCRCSQFFQKSSQHRSDLYVLQLNHVCYLDSAGVSGSCHHGGCRGCRSNNGALFADAEKDTCHHENGEGHATGEGAVGTGGGTAR